MKSKEEIEKLAFLKYPRVINDNPLCRNPNDPMEDDNRFDRKIWIGAYTQCQEDMAGKWISVKDELPPINVPLLCYQKNKNCQFRKMVLGFDGKEFKNFYNGNDDDILFEDGNYKFITHWMSLPNKPLNKNK